MTARHDLAAPADPAALLDRAIGFVLGAVHEVTPERLASPTPCANWNLRALLLHVTDSLEALCDGLGNGRVDLPAPAGPAACPDDPVANLRGQAARLRGVWAAEAGRGRPVLIADSALDPRIVLGVGAVEIAVHGWDICRACGLRRPIPPALAVELAAISVLVVTARTRYPSFAAPVAAPSHACPSDQLVAYLGRDPDSILDSPGGRA